MTITITDAFHLPRPEDIRAMGFVVKLREADAKIDEAKPLEDSRPHFPPPTTRAAKKSKATKAASKKRSRKNAADPDAGEPA